MPTNVLACVRVLVVSSLIGKRRLPLSVVVFHATVRRSFTSILSNKLRVIPYTRLSGISASLKRHVPLSPFLAIFGTSIYAQVDVGMPFCEEDVIIHGVSTWVVETLPLKPCMEPSLKELHVVSSILRRATVAPSTQVYPYCSVFGVTPNVTPKTEIR